MVTIVNKIASFVVNSYVNKVEEIRTQPIEAQQRVFKYLIERGKRTQYGQKFDFKNIKTYEDFKEKVPVVIYEELEPEIERARRGAADVLWPGKVQWFAKSSGTTNAKSKFIPITKESLEQNHFTSGKMLFANYLENHPNTAMFTKKNLRIGGSADLYQEYGTKYGDLSAIMIDNLPFWADYMNTPNKEISLLSDWNVKLDAIAQAAIKDSVGSLTGVPSWMLVLLNHCLSLTGKDHLHEIWPDLEVFFHGGISFKPYLKNYEEICGKEMRYYEIYNASEGYFSMQDLPDSKDMLLMLNTGIFFEFIPMEEEALKARKAVPLQEVELNKNYAIVISTIGGLWRYMIGDTVKFKSINPYRIVVSGRTKHYINAFGEEIIIENAEEALDFASNETGAKIKEYTGAPIFMHDKEKGAHEWVIEFEREPNDFEQFKILFDQKLKEINSDYEAKRYNNMTLNFPSIHMGRKDLFYDWMESRGKLGGQNKVPRLCNDREYIDPLLRLNQTES
ncbi:GH3 auxin-responsive promoter family protein [Ornithobacterium rhinotracheale]|uniref:GH3 auxin-responsive promoter-binding protein n=1 Tax=Ornithobacterium rhinotracheale (strain ATCC 51463 / DSM 15997 / CCUG 23171 / CIP 104009 / LMG 9086) TaxID=867902 RepID=I4A1J6_ORNRL|nr:GH3 auxin-responsive promoter family protein [Ornithobacterium rhinotracheale]AFL97830.1 GH3 auxin-responsive promoter-binding protein [Ornithobacterium rhinotracheale DSM 15997]AIP99656.1 auxin-regulated protein [Ornithobacterium rhinotracheale ORT-UMN 88]KGB65897.1 auxin-regulated protein [Ornithobacterium rhinotracheale H06-030791]MBN3661513.1 GH3 auxin-responsive promoter family protein [Ornithobacterium rhinotracheale]MCK0193873.1 GH3 auxin-responsive promoter family protein [Ornithoba